MRKRVAGMFALLVLTTTAMYAQPFLKYTNVASAGAGLGSSLGGFGYSSSTPALSAYYERGIWEVGGPGVISLGGYAGIKSYTYSNNYGIAAKSYTYNQKWSYTVVGVRSAYHYNGLKSEEFDVYGGLMMSYDILSYTYDDSNPTGVRYDNTGYGSVVGLSLYAGGRYFFAKNFAAFAEVGFGVSYLNLGLAYKF